MSVIVKSETIQNLWNLCRQNNPQQSENDLIISLLADLKSKNESFFLKSETFVKKIMCMFYRHNETNWITDDVIAEKFDKMLEEKWFEQIDAEVRKWIDNSSNDQDRFEISDYYHEKKCKNAKVLKKKNPEAYEKYVLETKNNWCDQPWDGCKEVLQSDREPWGLNLTELLELGPAVYHPILSCEGWTELLDDETFLNDFDFGIITSIMIANI